MAENKENKRDLQENLEELLLDDAEVKKAGKAKVYSEISTDSTGKGSAQAVDGVGKSTANTNRHLTETPGDQSSRSETDLKPGSQHGQAPVVSENINIDPIESGIQSENSVIDGQSSATSKEISADYEIKESEATDEKSGRQPA
jgi:hypothetical protein